MSDGMRGHRVWNDGVTKRPGNTSAWKRSTWDTEARTPDWGGGRASKMDDTSSNMMVHTSLLIHFLISA